MSPETVSVGDEVNMVLNIHIRFIQDGEKGERRYGRRGRLYTYCYAVTTRMTSALRWAAMRSILMFHKPTHGEVWRCQEAFFVCSLVVSDQVYLSLLFSFCFGGAG